ncbi:hypothetical protein M3A96_05065 [Helcobacillus massiliensis]|uniref:DUF6541 family protein n=1 Tax=Helcobacillus TaxID=1161125 RepID=UPI001EF5AC8A|nr:MULTISPECIES: DUF6541 family protein [Helcobacillus]MCG7426853.1 hypothetical protein [Helcobacillus sp. ACRRO]MCT1557485.1 hypothetical protein [Helcobacillus massiliensis]MCT2036334.1 hypothetical protein [Helcobacillus massiliensis]MCT2331924.1 hypothetical protein [Helcobacillus massiliensis]MDK7742228.1 hypothetical protein [Helcobacillus massiliensis]
MSAGYLVQWLSSVPLLTVLLAITVGPGYAVLRVLRMRTMLALAAGPAVTAFLAGGMAIVSRKLRVDWGWGPYLLVVVLAVITALVLRRYIVPPSARIFRKVPGSSPSRAELGAILAATVLFCLVTAVPLLQWVDPTVPSPRVDPMYHYNGLNAIGHSGDASMFSAMDFNYGFRTLHVTYPSVWHALTFLALPITDIVTGANVMGYLVPIVVFVIGLVALTREVFPDRPWMTVLSVVVAAGFPAFPSYIVLAKTFWPNGLGFAMLPGVLALIVTMRNGFRWGRARKRHSYALTVVAATGVAFAGAVLTHPSVFFTIVWVMIPVAVYAGLRVFKVQGRRWTPKRRLVTGGSVALAVVVAVLAMTSPTKVRGYLSRDSTANWDGALSKIVSTAVNWPVGNNPPMVLGYLLIFVPLILAGAVLAWRDQRTRWVTSAWLMLVPLILGTYFPLPVLSSVSGLWYSDTYRLFAVQNIFVSMLVAVVIDRMLGTPDAWARPVRALAKPGRLFFMAWTAGFVVLHTMMAMLLTIGYAKSVGAESPLHHPVSSEAELAMLKDLDRSVPAGSVIIGDPASGVAYVPLYSDAQSVFTQVNPRAIDFDGEYLYKHFDDITSDPLVCTILDHYGVAYFYEDTSKFYSGHEREEFAPGFYGVDTGSGFTLVAEGGDARVWRIDACGPIDPPRDWWDRSTRKNPVLSAPYPDEPVFPGANGGGSGGTRMSRD